MHPSCLLFEHGKEARCQLIKGNLQFKNELVGHSASIVLADARAGGQPKGKENFLHEVLVKGIKQGASRKKHSAVRFRFA